MIRTTRNRRGVTLVELLVAAAMMMLGMWLLVWVYQQGTASFLNAKAQADLTTQERTVSTVLNRDLGSTIFLGEEGKPGRGLRLSDQRTDLLLQGGTWTPPRGGYFSAQSLQSSALPNASDPYEATDSDGFVSARATDHFLQFTIILPGGPNYQMVSANLLVGPNTYSEYFGRAAEVTYALVPNGLRTAGGVPLYDLVRRQRLTALGIDDTPVYQTVANNGLAAGDTVSEVMTVTPVAIGSGPIPAPIPANTMLNLSNLTVPANRLQPAQWALTPASLRYGEERLMSNVLSFEVKFSGPPVTLTNNFLPTGYGLWSQDPLSNAWPRPFTGNITPNGQQAQGNTDFPYDYLPFDGRFDTYTTQVAGGWQSQIATTTAPTNPIKPIRITGVLIRLRAYDLKNQTTRQTTIAASL
jgi:hypothetical protein